MWIVLVILVCALTITFFISRWRLRAILASQSRIVETTAGPVEYIDVGEGPVVVHAHGMLGGFDHWRWCEFMVKAGFRVVVPSRPGYLRTPLASGRTPAEQAALIAALLDVLDIDQIGLYAYSQGGAAALQFAWDYPERCRDLILFSAFIRPQPELIKLLPYIRVFVSLDFIVWLLRPVLLPWVMSQAKKSLSKEIQQDQEKMMGIQEMFEAIFQASLRGQGFVNDFSNTVYWAGLPLDRLRTPTLILHGSKDAFIKPSDSAAAADEIPGARFICLDGAGHEAIVTCTDQIKPEVLDFLNAHIPEQQISVVSLSSVFLAW